MREDKKMIRRREAFDFNNVPVEQAVKELQRYADMYAECSNIITMRAIEDGGMESFVTSSRLETDEEYDTRKVAEAAADKAMQEEAIKAHIESLPKQIKCTEGHIEALTEQLKIQMQLREDLVEEMKKHEENSIESSK